jgi:hypothetical protein
VLDWVGFIAAQWVAEPKPWLTRKAAYLCDGDISLAF